MNELEPEMDKGERDIEREAAEWLALLDDAGRSVDAREQREWMDWLRRSPRHVQAYLDVANVSQMVDEVPPVGRARLRAMLASHRAQPRPTWRRPASRWMLAAAAMACIVAGAAWFAMSPSRYSTGVGEQVRYQLADGSSMLLNTRSRARVSMNERERLVELDGEALFTVVADKARPFRVRTLNTVAQAIGTRFNVYVQESGATKVSVVEGAVKISAISADVGVEPLLLSAGQEAEVRKSRVSLAPVPKVSASVAWKNGMLVFEDATIGEVAAQFNRYNELQFSMAPEVAGRRRLSGTFDPGRPENFRAFLERDRSLAVGEAGGVVQVRSAQP
jgi:transmembrane sensor